MSNDINQASLEYHKEKPAGKLAIVATKPLENQNDLSLAYSPGVAACCKAIVDDPSQASKLTSRGNLVAVISDGTAVLGLGNIGPLASKPVMEGKAVLFKKFAGIDVFDIEVDSKGDKEKFCEIVAALEPTFGGINLEDIKAPECFYIEKTLIDKMSIPVFHDDQHGTAIIVAAAVINATYLSKTKVEDCKIVCSGAGAAAMACLKMLIAIGAQEKNIWLSDSKGLITKKRNDLTDEHRKLAQDSDSTKLDQVMEGANIFLGLSVGGIVSRDMVKKMAPNPLIMALANPTPEIMPDEVLKVRSDAIIATGRSDFVNQVNNVLCFPYIFRGALDCEATEINEAMKMAAAQAIASLARKEVSDLASRAYGEESINFGTNYIIPKPFDPRLILEIAPAVAKAAAKSKIAKSPIKDLDAYVRSLEDFVYKSGSLMKAIYTQAQTSPKRIVFAEGEDRRVLRAVQTIIDERLAKPILVGRQSVINSRLKKLGLRYNTTTDVTIVDPTDDERYNQYWQAYHKLLAREGITPAVARVALRTRTTAIAGMLVRLEAADGLICGVKGGFDKNILHIKQTIGLKENVETLSTINLLVLDSGPLFIVDTHVNKNPTAEELVNVTKLAAEEVKRFGIEPRVAMISHSNFGSQPSESASVMAEATRLIKEQCPNIIIEGEMQGDTALLPEVQNSLFPDNTLKGKANLLIMPNLDAANISYNLVKVLAQGLSLGPILLGQRLPAHILTEASTTRNIIDMTALVSIQSQLLKTA